MNKNELNKKGMLSFHSKSMQNRMIKDTTRGEIKKYFISLKSHACDIQEIIEKHAVI